MVGFLIYLYADGESFRPRCRHTKPPEGAGSRTGTFRGQPTGFPQCSQNFLPGRSSPPQFVQCFSPVCAAGGVTSGATGSAAAWTASAGRVFLVNTDRMKPADYHRTLNDMMDPRYPGKSVGIAYPMFGTTATQAAALYSALGRDKAHAFYRNLS